MSARRDAVGLAFTDAGSRWLTVNTIKARCRMINQFVDFTIGYPCR
jgi:hypothetical protein